MSLVTEGAETIPNTAAQDVNNNAPEVKTDDAQTKNDASTEPTQTEKKDPEAEKPVVYDLKLPEGSLLSSDVIAKVESLAKEKGMTPDQAQALLEHESAVLAEHHAGIEKEFQETTKKWVDEVKFKENVALAHAALKQFGSEKFNQELERTGFGNHPELVRIFARIGRQLQAQPMARGEQPNQAKSITSIMYDKTNQ
jgi:hypothetical protein